MIYPRATGTTNRLRERERKGHENSLPHPPLQRRRRSPQRPRRRQPVKRALGGALKAWFSKHLVGLGTGVQTEYRTSGQTILWRPPTHFSLHPKTPRISVDRTWNHGFLFPRRHDIWPTPSRNDESQASQKVPGAVQPVQVGNRRAEVMAMLFPWISCHLLGDGLYMVWRVLFTSPAGHALTLSSSWTSDTSDERTGVNAITHRKLGVFPLQLPESRQLTSTMRYLQPDVTGDIRQLTRPNLFPQR